MSDDRTALVRAARTLERLRSQRPRVQCLTNTVAQALTANVLHALGAGASMATHPDEVVDMTVSADALLVNLGTPDTARIAAIHRLAGDKRLGRLPVVLDPVFVQNSALRQDLARVLLASSLRVIKGNAAEIAAVRRLTGFDAAQVAAVVTTGEVDRIEDRTGAVRTFRHGHRWMADVTGLGCALGAVIAACAAVEPDAIDAATAAVSMFGLAGARAGAATDGPGSFAVAFIDALSQLDADTIAEPLA